MKPSGFGAFGNYLGNDADYYTPNRATYLFVLIYKFRLAGMSYADALIMAKHGNEP